MQPQETTQPVYAQPPTQNNPGGFTLKQKRIMLATGVLFVLFIFLMIIAAVFGGEKSTTEVTLTSVSARNSEVIRLIDELEEELTTSAGKAYATQTRILLTSDNLIVIDYTNSTYSSSHSSEQVANTEIASTIAALGERTNQNDFDEVFIDSIQFELELNKALLEQINLEGQDKTLTEITTTAIANYSSLL